MKRIGRSLPLLGIVLVACKPATTGELSVERRAAIADSVRTVMTTIAKDVTAKDFTVWLPYLERSDRFIWTADGEIPFTSADSLERFIKDFSATLIHTELTWLDQRVSALGPGLALVTTPYREMYVGKKADTTRVAGVFVGVWASLPTGWKIVSGNTSHPQPATGRH